MEAPKAKTFLVRWGNRAVKSETEATAPNAKDARAQFQEHLDSEIRDQHLMEDVRIYSVRPCEEAP